MTDSKEEIKIFYISKNNKNIRDERSYYFALRILKQICEEGLTALVKILILGKLLLYSDENPFEIVNRLRDVRRLSGC